MAIEALAESGLVMAILRGHLEAMSVVKVAELKRRLSHYLRLVRRGAGKLPRGWLGRRPAVTADVVGALLEERRDGR